MGAAREQGGQRRLLAALLTLVVATVSGGLALVVSSDGADSGEHGNAVALGEAPLADVVSVTADAVDDRETPPAEDVHDEPGRQPEAPGDDEAPPLVAPGFLEVSAGGVIDPTRVQDHEKPPVWPPPVVMPPPPDRGHPERSSALAHRRPAAAHDRPALLLVRVFAAESGEPLRDADVEVLHASPMRAAPLGPDQDLDDFWPLEPGPLDVRIRCPGRVPWHERSLVAATGSDLVLDVHLELGQVVEGVLTTSGDVPIEGARVRLWPADAWWPAWPFEEPPPTLLEATSDAAGMWRIDSAPRLVSLVMEAQGEEIQAEEIPGDEGLGGGRPATLRRGIETGPETAQPLCVDARLPRGRRVRVRVLTADGSAAAGAFVFAPPWELTELIDASNLVSLTEHERAEVVLNYIVLRIAGRERRLFMTTARAITDADGFCELGGLDAAQAHGLFAWQEGRGRSELVLVDDDAGSAGDSAGDVRELRLRGLTTEAVFVSNASSEPIEGARVTRAWAVHETVLPAGAPGVHGPVAAEVGPSVVVATHPERPRQAFAGVLRPGVDNRSTIVLGDGVAISGIVRAAGGGPLRGALIQTDERSTFSDEQGRFALAGLPEGRNILRATKTGFTERAFRVAAPSESARLTLHPSVTVRLQLVVPAGDPDPAWVSATVDPPRFSWDRGGDDTAVVTSLDWDDGRVELRAVRNEDGVVVAVVPGYRIARVHFTGQSGRIVDLGRAELRPARRIEGRVRSATGAEVAGARVAVEAADDGSNADSLLPRSQVARVAPGGGFHVLVPWEAEDEIAGRLIVSAPGYVPQAFEIDGDFFEKAHQPLVAVLHRGSLVRGIVVDARARPVARAWVAAVEDTLAETDSDGRFVLRVGAFPLRVRAVFSQRFVDNVAWWRPWLVDALFGTRGLRLRDLAAGAVDLQAPPADGDEIRIVLAPVE